MALNRKKGLARHSVGQSDHPINIQNHQIRARTSPFLVTHPFPALGRPSAPKLTSIRVHQPHRRTHQLPIAIPTIATGANKLRPQLHPYFMLTCGALCVRATNAIIRTRLGTSVPSLGVFGGPVSASLATDVANLRSPRTQRSQFRLFGSSSISRNMTLFELYATHLAGDLYCCSTFTLRCSHSRWLGIFPALSPLNTLAFSSSPSAPTRSL